MNAGNKFLYSIILTGLLIGPPMMLIVFHLDRFDRFGYNRTILTISASIIILIASIAGYKALLRIKVIERSQHYDKKYSEKIRKIRKLKRDEEEKNNRKSDLDNKNEVEIKSS